MFRISIEIDNETRPEELVREAGAVTHFLKDVLDPYDDELHVGENGKWGLGPIFKY